MCGLNKKLRSMSMAALTIGAVVCGAAGAAEQLPEITVEGSRVARSDTPSKHPGFPPDEIINLSRTVDYSDLDISTVSGARELEKRVAVTAKQVCSELDRMTLNRDQDCVKQAIATGKKNVDVAIRAAEQARTAAR